MEINAKMVNALRNRTGAGMMDCKKALIEANGDEEKAVEILRKHGSALADKKAARTASQGLIASDFVAKNEDFKAFVKDLCMHIAAAAPICISKEDVPADIIAKEREIAMAQLEGDKKPEAIKEKIVNGKIDKFVSGVALLEQPFVKDDSMTIGDLIKSKIATIGEKIEVKRFTRYQI